MKTSETLKAIHEASRGGSYFDKKSFIEAIVVGCFFGITAVASLQIDNPFLRIIPFIPIIALLTLKRNSFRGWKRLSHPIGIQYSTGVFKILYSFILGFTVLLIVYSSKYLWGLVF